MEGLFAHESKIIFSDVSFSPANCLVVKSNPVRPGSTEHNPVAARCSDIGRWKGGAPVPLWLSVYARPGATGLSLSPECTFVSPFPSSIQPQMHLRYEQQQLGFYFYDFKCCTHPRAVVSPI